MLSQRVILRAFAHERVRGQYKVGAGMTRERTWCSSSSSRNSSSTRSGVLRSRSGLCIPRRVCSSSRYSLVLSCVVWLEIKDERAWKIVQSSLCNILSGTELGAPAAVCKIMGWSESIKSRKPIDLSFIPSVHMETESKARASLGKLLVSHLRYASQVLQNDPNT